MKILGVAILTSVMRWNLEDIVPSRSQTNVTRRRRECVSFGLGKEMTDFEEGQFSVKMGCYYVNKLKKGLVGNITSIVRTTSKS